MKAFIFTKFDFLIEKKLFFYSYLVYHFLIEIFVNFSILSIFDNILFFILIIIFYE